MVECDVHTDRVRRGLERMVAFDRIIRETAGNAGADTMVLFTADHSFALRVHDGGGNANLLEGLDGVPAAANGNSMDELRLPNLSMDGTPSSPRSPSSARNALPLMTGVVSPGKPCRVRSSRTSISTRSSSSASVTRSALFMKTTM